MEIIHRDGAQAVQALPGWVRRVLAYSPDIMLVESVLAAGTALPTHQHPHEQILYVQSGELLLDCQGRQTPMRTGDSCAIPGGVAHGVVAITDLVALDIFTPAREDFLPAH